MSIPTPVVLSLFEWREVRPKASPRASEQGKNLARVERGIGATVLAFCRGKVGAEFTISEFQGYVASRHPSAPASPDRILRSLRQRGVLEYVVVDRARARYRVTRCP